MTQDITRLRGSFLLICLLITNIICIQISNVSSSDTQDVSYTYTIWVGSSVTESYTIPLTSPANSNFYDAMIKAAEIDPNFAFECKDTSFGHYVTTLAGTKEDTTNNIYWLLYILPEFPDVNKKPGQELMSPVGVDGLIVENGKHYLFWYRHFSYST